MDSPFPVDIEIGFGKGRFILQNPKFTKYKFIGFEVKAGLVEYVKNIISLENLEISMLRGLTPIVQFLKKSLLAESEIYILIFPIPGGKDAIKKKNSSERIYKFVL